MDNCFFKGKERRETEPEILEWMEKTLGITMVEGFYSLVNQGDAVVSTSSRHDNYHCRSNMPQYYYSLSSKESFSFYSSEIPKNTNDKIAFYLNIGFGNGHPMPQSTGQYDIYVNGHYAISIRVVKHHQVWSNDNCILGFSVHRNISVPAYQYFYLNEEIQQESWAVFGPALLIVPSDWVKNSRNAVIEIKAKCDDTSTRWISFMKDDVTKTQTNQWFNYYTNIYKLVNLINSNGHSTINGYNFYFGDIHTHSAEVTNPPFADSSRMNGCGYGTRKSNYEYAKGPGGLDFYALTEHEWQIKPTNEDIESYFKLADKYNDNGKFVCIPAFEHTNRIYGHRNVYFSNSNGVIINDNKSCKGPTLDAEDTITPDELWEKLKKNNTPFFTVPHHPSAVDHPCNINIINPSYDRLIEVYSTWGSSEYDGDFPRGISDRYKDLYTRDSLNLGHQMGLIASSDGHDGHPGNSQSYSFKHQHIYHFLGSGYTGVLAKSFDRDSIFTALFHRRCYGTTGVPIVLYFDINGEIMGSEIENIVNNPALNIICHGTTGIDHIRIIKNGIVVKTLFTHGEPDINIQWIDNSFSKENNTYYYVRVVQKDGESAWSSPIWINNI